MRLAATHPTWAVGFEDEVWWSRYTHPDRHAWVTGTEPLRLVERPVDRKDPDPKALACYGLLVPGQELAPDQMLLRFVEGQPVSGLTTQFLDWCSAQLARHGYDALLLIWDNASWHYSHETRAWIGAHNRQVKATGVGVRIVPCFLPSKSPWLNPIEPRWVHAKRAVDEPAVRLTAQELASRVCAYFGCESHAPLTMVEKVS
ncbi:MAG: transposase [Chloroflexi bacterium]|nr:transposase [Chloroflexota bacterium]